MRYVCSETIECVRSRRDGADGTGRMPSIRRRRWRTAGAIDIKLAPAIGGDPSLLVSAEEVAGKINSGIFSTRHGIYIARIQFAFGAGFCAAKPGAAATAVEAAAASCGERAERPNRSDPPEYISACVCVHTPNNTRLRRVDA